MDQKPAHEKRRWPRYDISPIPSVKATVPVAQVPKKLGTFGMGGCGFWSEGLDPALTVGQDIACTISFEGILPKSIDVIGRLQYVKELPYEGKTHHYYGLEFKPGYEDMLSPIIRYLEKLEKLGRILVSVD